MSNLSLITLGECLGSLDPIISRHAHGILQRLKEQAREEQEQQDEVQEDTISLEEKLRQIL